MSEFETRIFIDGQFVQGQGLVELAFELAHGTPLAEVASASSAQIDTAIAAADAAYKGWARHLSEERSAALWRIADLTKENADVLANVESRNAGKPLRFVKSGELANVADVFRFYATVLRNMPAPASGNYRPP